MIDILCAVCDEFIEAYLIDKHSMEKHPEQDMIKLTLWPDGEPVVRLKNEFDLFT